MSAHLGMDARGEVERQVRHVLFGRHATHRAGRHASSAETPGVDSTMPEVFPSSRDVHTPHGHFAYVRIATFNVESDTEFLDEFIRIAGQLSQNGLILDVRGNGGGLIHAGERLLQLLTPRPIEPCRFHFLNSTRTRADQPPPCLREMERVDRAGGRNRRRVLAGPAAAAGSRLQRHRPEISGAGRARHRRAVLQHDRHLRRRVPGQWHRHDPRHRREHRRGRRQRLGVPAHFALLRRRAVPESAAEQRVVPLRGAAGDPRRQGQRPAARGPRRHSRPGARSSRVADVLQRNLDLITRAADDARRAAEAAADRHTCRWHDGANRSANVDCVDAFLQGRPLSSVRIKRSTRAAGTFTLTVPPSRYHRDLRLEGLRNGKVVAATRLRACAELIQENLRMPINFIPNDPSAAASAPEIRKQAKRPNRPASRAGLHLLEHRSRRHVRARDTRIPVLAVPRGGAGGLDAWESVAGKLNGLAGEPQDARAAAGRRRRPQRVLRPLQFRVLPPAIGGTTFFSGASTDVVAHEIGHGLLDAIRPDLWDAAFLEAGAFHEAFGDCIAILTALHDRETRVKLLACDDRP